MDISIAFFNVIVLSIILTMIVGVVWFYMIKDKDKSMIHMISLALMIVCILVIVLLVFYSEFFGKKCRFD